MSPFVHLHVHTHYSLLDGANKVPELVKQAKTLGMEALAITDHGCMFGVIEFYNECHKQGIKPILGMEAYIAPGDRRERSTPGGNAGEAAFHLLLLAQNLAGYQNLLKLASIAYREGFYYKPRIDKQVLRELNGGLIATSACLGGEIPSAILRHDKAGARRITESYLDIFGPDRFFIEVQKQGIAEQDTANPELADLAKRLGCGLVATNDVHFLRRQDHHAHDVLCCISMGRLITDENRLKYPAELYLKSPQEMQQALGAYPEALANTAAIAAQCELKLDFGKLHAPVYKVPVEKLPAPAPQDAGQGDDERYLRRLCEEGLAWRYGTTDVAPEIRARLEHELKIITHKGFCSYFLIVWDFCNYARSQNIPVGARGSAVGTMVGYLLGLCNVDPLRYGLLFERFMDPSRSELPDIDIDICQDGRARVIEYVRQKYGHVAQIITFGTLAAKAACKDVGRVLGVPLAEVDKLTKLIPNSPAMTLDKALEHSPDLQKLYHENPTITRVIDTARSLEGLCRNAGCHAAGVIIADQPLENLVPLYRDSEGTILTQFDGPVVDKAGLLKMDFLGLRTLTTLHRSIELVKQNQGVDIDIEKLDFADQKVFELFRQGRTKGIFQFESGGMQDLLMKMRPDRIEDLIAANALYRPGPMELIPVYCQRKHGREAIPTVHPIMDAILKETYGVMVYQEQVMQIFNQLGGIELANAYKLIKAISKKTVEVIAKFQPQFLKGCVERGISQAKAQELFELILKFGGYGFNKCVVGQTRIMDAHTGRRTTVGELFRHRGEFHIHALGEDGRLHPRRVLDVVWNGRKVVYELCTAQGRKIRATANHPFRTLSGWTLLEDLKVGDRIAAARRLDVGCQRRWAKHELVVLAGLLSEGNTCHPSCLYFFSNEPILVDDFATAAAQFEQTVARLYRRRENRYEVCLSTGRDGRFRAGHEPWNATSGGDVGVLTRPRLAPARSGAYRWARKLGIVDCKATRKFVPPEVFELCDADLELFLGRLWAGDGFLANADQAVPYYATSSEQLAIDVQTLLLRLGIHSGVHRKQFKYRGGLRPGYTVHLVGEGARQRFVQRVVPHCIGRAAQVEQLVAHLQRVEAGRSSKDTVPAEIRTWVDEQRRARGLTWKALEGQADLSMKEFCGRGSAGKKGFRRSTVARLGEFFSCEHLQLAAQSDIFWDRVTSIERVGVDDTYDLTVEHDHNFVADGLIVHNSHSTRYAIVAYQTAHMKVYHPVQYMAALLTYEVDKPEKVVEYIDECRRIALPDGTRGIRVLPPDVNESDKDFTPLVESAPTPAPAPRARKSHAKAAAGHVTPIQPTIRFGMMAVRGVGEKAVEAILQERQRGGPFQGLYDFCERVDLRQVTRTTIEALVKCGAFCFGGVRRSQLLAALDRAVEVGHQTQQDKRMGQMNIFGGDSSAGAVKLPSVALPELAELEPAELLKFEKELLGFYVTSHPLSEHQLALERFSGAGTRDPLRLPEGMEVVMGGMVGRVSRKVAKSGRSAGQPWAVVTLEDLDGQIDAMVFADALADITRKCPDALSPEKVVFLKGKIDKRRQTPCLIVSDAIPIEQAPARLTTSILLLLEPQRHQPPVLAELKPLLARHRGHTPVFARVVLPDSASESALLRLPSEYSLRPSPAMMEELELLLGPGAVQLHGAGSKRVRQLKQQRLFGDDTPTEPPQATETEPPLETDVD